MTLQQAIADADDYIYFDGQSLVIETYWEKRASEAGLDVDRFLACVEDNVVDDRIVWPRVLKRIDAHGDMRGSKPK